MTGGGGGGQEGRAPRAGQASGSPGRAAGPPAGPGGLCRPGPPRPSVPPAPPSAERARLTPRLEDLLGGQHGRHLLDLLHHDVRLSSQDLLQPLQLLGRVLLPLLRPHLPPPFAPQALRHVLRGGKRQSVRGKPAPSARLPPSQRPDEGGGWGGASRPLPPPGPRSPQPRTRPAALPYARLRPLSAHAQHAGRPGPAPPAGSTVTLRARAQAAAGELAPWSCGRWGGWKNKHRFHHKGGGGGGGRELLFCPSPALPLC